MLLAELVAFFLLIFATSCWNRVQVLSFEVVYYIDADCYARMTRGANGVQPA